MEGADLIVSYRIGMFQGRLEQALVGMRLF
jgi:hypothetical protein